jgi:hypothetical protein
MLSKDLLEAIQPFVEALEKLGINYYLGGSVVSSTWGRPRSTLDVDLVADIGTEQIAPLVEQLEERYYIDGGMIDDAIQRRASFNVIHLKTFIKVDVFIPDESVYSKLEAERVRQRLVGEGELAREYKVSSPEDIILRKLQWYRLGGEVIQQQWNDILGVLKMRAITLDTDYLRQWAAHLEVADLLERAIQQSGLAEPPLA